MPQSPKSRSLLSALSSAPLRRRDLSTATPLTAPPLCPNLQNLEASSPRFPLRLCVSASKRTPKLHVHRGRIRPVRILIVEDEPEAASVLAQGLREQAYSA